MSPTTASTSITNRPQVHEELLSLFRRGEIRRAAAAEAIATAKVEVAARGLNATVIQNYYAIASAQRKFTNAQTSLREAEQFLDITQKQEKGGEAAHADVIKAQIQQQQRQRDLQDAQVAIEKAQNRARRPHLPQLHGGLQRGRRPRPGRTPPPLSKNRGPKPSPPAPT